MFARGSRGSEAGGVPVQRHQHVRGSAAEMGSPGCESQSLFEFHRVVVIDVISISQLISRSIEMEASLVWKSPLC